MQDIVQSYNDKNEGKKSSEFGVLCDSLTESTKVKDTDDNKAMEVLGLCNYNVEKCKDNICDKGES